MRGRFDTYEPTDAEIISSVLAGDADAFAVLVVRYRDAYTRYAVRMLGSLEDADDALQTAFVRAFRNLRQCKMPDRFGAWLHQIVVNECRTAGTRRGRREKWQLPENDDFASTPAAAVASGVELRQDIQRALDRLPTDQREAFVLKHVEELSYEEMADVTGVGVSALKMRVKRACDELRKLLEGAHHD